MFIQIKQEWKEDDNSCIGKKLQSLSLSLDFKCCLQAFPLFVYYIDYKTHIFPRSNPIYKVFMYSKHTPTRLNYVYYRNSLPRNGQTKHSRPIFPFSFFPFASPCLFLLA
jgi:hypothetical protein